MLMYEIERVITKNYYGVLCSNEKETEWYTNLRCDTNLRERARERFKKQREQLLKNQIQKACINRKKMNEHNKHTVSKGSDKKKHTTLQNEWRDMQRCVGKCAFECNSKFSSVFVLTHESSLFWRRWFFCCCDLGIRLLLLLPLFIRCSSHTVLQFHDAQTHT